MKLKKLFKKNTTEDMKVKEIVNLYSTKELIKRNPNQEIHKETGLTKEEYMKLAKYLKGHRVDFAIEKNGANDTFNVVVMQSCYTKELIENFSNPELKINFVDELIAEAKITADKMNKKNSNSRYGSGSSGSFLRGGRSYEGDQDRD